MYLVVLITNNSNFNFLDLIRLGGVGGVGRSRGFQNPPRRDLGTLVLRCYSSFLKKNYRSSRKCLVLQHRFFFNFGCMMLPMSCDCLPFLLLLPPPKKSRFKHTIRCGLLHLNAYELLVKHPPGSHQQRDATSRHVTGEEEEGGAMEVVVLREGIPANSQIWTSSTPAPFPSGGSPFCA